MTKKYVVIWCSGSKSVGASLKKAVKLARSKSSIGACKSKVMSEWPSGDPSRFRGQAVVLCKNKVCKPVPGVFQR